MTLRVPESYPGAVGAGSRPAADTRAATAEGGPCTRTRALLRVVAWARRAPRTGQTLPLVWTVGEDALLLGADLAQRSARSADDPVRQIIDAGAALHHARVAAEAIGWATAVDRFPDPDDPDLVARVRLTVAVPSLLAASELAALAGTRSGRPLDHVPVPEPALHRLAGAAAREGAYAVPVVGRSETGAATSWVVLGGPDDTPASWLRTGEGLSAAMLQACRDELLAEPLPVVPQHLLDAADSGLLNDTHGRATLPHLVLRVALAGHLD
ncbi:MAG: hypothetical protein CMH83_18035 [Nocardioides sp.]|nr:hypothetical protein [Nocardioides sp.]